MYSAGPTGEYLNDWYSQDLSSKYSSYSEYAYERKKYEKNAVAYYWKPYTVIIPRSGYALVNGHLSEIQLPGEVIIGQEKVWVTLNKSEAQSGEGGGFKELFEASEAGVVALRSATHGSELFIQEVAGAKTYYSTVSGGTKYIGKARLLSYAEVLGKYTFGAGGVVNVIGVAEGEQSWGKEALNIGVEAPPFIIGTGPGMVVGLIYFTMDKTVGWDRVLTPTPNHPGTFIDENRNMELR